MVPITGAIEFKDDGTFCGGFGLGYDCDSMTCACDAIDSPVTGGSSQYSTPEPGRGQLMQGGVLVEFFYCVQGDQIEIGFPQMPTQGGSVVVSYAAQRSTDTFDICTPRP
jgi:hypothetical protein